MMWRFGLGCVLSVSAAGSAAFAPGGGAAGTTGGDIAACAVPAAQAYASVGDIFAFSIATTHWNAGDEALQWVQATSNHPVIAQNMYRYRNGRIEQIGMSWLVHGFCALQNGGCGQCIPDGSGCLQLLSVGCADVHGASINGFQAIMGPRSDVNPSTGACPYPYTIGWNQSGDSVYKRLQVHFDDLDPALNEGAAFYFEPHFIHPQESGSDRRHNNASHRRFNLAYNAVAGSWSLTFGGPTVQFLPAIYAWQAHDPLVAIEIVDIPGEPTDGRFHLAYRVTDNGDGTWRYEYAVHNLNSHRAAQAFSVPLPDGVNISSTFHRDVKHHSGEVYTNEDWTLVISDDAITWSGEPFSKNENANALRWGTMFNFGFVADVPPVLGDATLTLFRPGAPDAVLAAALVPGVPDQPPCAGDLDSTGEVDVFDLLELLAAWGPCGSCAADLDESGEVDVFDLLMLLAHWGPCN
jgi:hypothetical protein